CFVSFFFFFSSRRRHTRSYGDWSSDVCSSDLLRGLSNLQSRKGDFVSSQTLATYPGLVARCLGQFPSIIRNAGQVPEPSRGGLEIGRASCRERVWGAGVGGSLKGRG